MKLRTLALMCASTSLIISCNTTSNDSFSTRSQLAADPLLNTSPVSGRYDVKGYSVPEGSHEKRKISGTVMLAVEEGRYTATYDLMTSYRGTEGLMGAKVIGTGEGRVHGSRLVGNAETQAVVSMVPGLSPQFAYAPRFAVKRVLSDSEARILADGRVEFTIVRAQEEEGRHFASSRIRLKGARVGVWPPGEEFPALAAASGSSHH